MRRQASPAHAGMYPARGAVDRDHGGFPRTRGDVPQAIVGDGGVYRLPPHTRGCTRHPLPGRGRAAASPAHAGMYPPLGLFQKRGHRFPRTRGDVPGPLVRGAATEQLPPHTRGCTRAPILVRSDEDASPAHAGMYLGQSGAGAGWRGFPRTRGDVPVARGGSRDTAGLPPHTRGCTLAEVEPTAAELASPAHAGMYLGGRPVIRRPTRFPRTRGDVPPCWPRATGPRLLPPHTRGCTRRVGPCWPGYGASPAHAGMYRSCTARSRSVGSFPRTRGDVPMIIEPEDYNIMLPPHTRGCTELGPRAQHALRASPAHAGMYLALASCPRRGPGFPRTRGDVPAHGADARGDRELPPHTRGCTCHGRKLLVRDQASPAHAGMYPSPARASR